MKITTKVKDPFTLGQILQQGRLQQGLSQRQLAKELGTNQKWIWEMEQGKPGILMDRLFEMLDTVGINLLAELELTEDSIGEDNLDAGEVKEGSVTSSNKAQEGKPA